MNAVLIRANIVGKTIEDVKKMNIDFGTNYPVVKNGIVVGVVDGNYPYEYNDGKWEIVHGFYAEAYDPEEGE